MSLYHTGDVHATPDIYLLCTCAHESDTMVYYITAACACDNTPPKLRSGRDPSVSEFVYSGMCCLKRAAPGSHASFGPVLDVRSHQSFYHRNEENEDNSEWLQSTDMLCQVPQSHHSAIFVHTTRRMCMWLRAPRGYWKSSLQTFTVLDPGLSRVVYIFQSTN